MSRRARHRRPWRPRPAVVEALGDGWRWSAARRLVRRHDLETGGGRPTTPRRRGRDGRPRRAARGGRATSSAASRRTSPWRHPGRDVRAPGSRGNLRPTYLDRRRPRSRSRARGRRVDRLHVGAAVALPRSRAPPATPRQGGGRSPSRKAVADEGARTACAATWILPTVIDTPANRAADARDRVAQFVPPAEIAAVVAFLAARRSAINGAEYASSRRRTGSRAWPARSCPRRLATELNAIAKPGISRPASFLAARLADHLRELGGQRLVARALPADPGLGDGSRRRRPAPPAPRRVVDRARSAPAARRGASGRADRSRRPPR